MKKYKEYTPTELGISKTSWCWFPVVLADGPDAHTWYSNGHLLIDKSPVRTFPDVAPESTHLVGKGKKAFDTPWNVGYTTRRMPKTLPNAPLTVASMTERNRKTEDPKDSLGHVALSDSDGEIYMGRHYYAKLCAMYKGIEFYRSDKGKTSTIIGVHQGVRVAYAMPVRV